MTGPPPDGLLGQDAGHGYGPWTPPAEEWPGSPFGHHPEQTRSVVHARRGTPPGTGSLRTGFFGFTDPSGARTTSPDPSGPAGSPLPRRAAAGRVVDLRAAERGSGDRWPGERWAAAPPSADLGVVDLPVVDLPVVDLPTVHLRDAAHLPMADGATSGRPVVDDPRVRAPRVLSRREALAEERAARAGRPGGTPPVADPVRRRGSRTADRTAGPVGRATRSPATRDRGAPAAAPAARGTRRPGISVSMPQVGIASGLGLLTIAAPLAGVMSGPPAKAAVASVSSVIASAEQNLGAGFPRSSAGGGLTVQALSLVPDDSALPSVPTDLAAPRSMIVIQVSRASERALLPGCSGQVPIVKVSNGNLPAVDLCTLWDRKHRIRADAAIALAKLNLLYRQAFGHDLCLTDGYRTLAQQYAIRAARGGYAAVPGTSEHGWGLAVDACDGISNGESNPNYRWMVANGRQFGWVNPAWALPGGGGPYEPWHFEWLPGEVDQSGTGE